MNCMGRKVGRICMELRRRKEYDKIYFIRKN